MPGHVLSSEGFGRPWVQSCAPVREDPGTGPGLEERKPLNMKLPGGIQMWGAQDHLVSCLAPESLPAGPPRPPAPVGALATARTAWSLWVSLNQTQGC